jgi:glycosyltransferase involved in cell wall biosynthesis
MKEAGIETTIIAASLHYGRQVTQVSPRVRLENLDDAQFLWLRARSYTGNGLGRVISMLDFSLWVIIRCWFPQRINIPSPDVIVGSSPHLFGALAGWILAKRHGVPFVLEVRDLWPKSLETLLGLKPHHPLIMLMGAVEKFLYRRSTIIIGLLGGVGAHVSSCAGPNSAPVLCIPNGVDLGAVPAATPLRDSRDFTIVYTGAHGPPNSLNTVLEASRLLQESGATSPNGGSFRFNFYGDGVCKSDLVSYARLHGLRSVVFHDVVPKLDVFGVLSEGDACLLTGLSTKLYESGVSPNKLFDYFAAGRPVLCGIYSPNDPVSEAQAGFIVTPEDPIALVNAINTLSRMSLSDRQTLGNNGRAFVELHHDSRRLAARYAEALSTVIR